MTLEEMARERRSTKSSENSTQEKSTDILTKLNEENKHLSEQNKTLMEKNSELTAKNTTLTKKNTSLTKTIDQQEETIRAMNAKLMFPPTPKKEYITRRVMYERCEKCEIGSIRESLSKIKRYFTELSVYTLFFMMITAVKNGKIRGDIVSMAESLKNFCAAHKTPPDMTFAQIFGFDKSTTDPQKAKICGIVLAALIIVIAAALILVVGFLAAYSITYLLDEYWDIWHTRLTVGNAALVIILSDLPKLQMGINAFLLYIMLMIGTFVLRAMLKKW